MLGNIRQVGLARTRLAWIGRAAKPSGGKPIPYGAATHTSNDRRHDVIKKVLFDLPPRESILETGEDQARHETIERAWQLYVKNQTEQREKATRTKFERMQQAFEELRQTDYRLFKGAVNKDTTLTFPHGMKVPSETPPTSGWKYTYEPSSSS
ncbi:hypothetical protein IWQ62_002254 [Dispira parvispora]|uniref:Large ribosomal subunit protein mL40 n=1 Tax=Dispira parvispora TaxID=1520584 RepID=A0A9W8AX54_9FUNG|nr:hypothetical protein IWQ62_002254 [Dispira parvispora]